jgi:hypothetical protein
MLINFLMDVILYDVHNDSGEPKFGLEYAPKIWKSYVYMVVGTWERLDDAT